jgi:hypothetical protein
LFVAGRASVRSAYDRADDGPRPFSSPVRVPDAGK